MFSACSSEGGRTGPDGPGGFADAKRIVSLSPSTTETLFRLDLGGRLVGVSRFCALPPEAGPVEQVGGYLDPNYEKIASLRPDVVMLLPEQGEAARYLGALGIYVMTVDNKTVDDILDGITSIGNAFGKSGAADSLTGSIVNRIEAVRDAAAGRERPRVLVSIGHDFGSGKAREVYAAGKRTYYDELLTIAGSDNVCREGMGEFPILSPEGLISMDPDVIIELVPPGAAGGMQDEDIAAEWQYLSNVKAVRDDRVYILRDRNVHIPGPGFIDLLESIAGLLGSEGG